MDVFCQKLIKMGYEKVELLDAAEGSFMSSKEARAYMLTGARLLFGKKIIACLEGIAAELRAWLLAHDYNEVCELEKYLPKEME